LISWGRQRLIASMPSMFHAILVTSKHLSALASAHHVKSAASTQHLAFALGLKAVAHGYGVYFITVHELTDVLARG